MAGVYVCRYCGGPIIFRMVPAEVVVEREQDQEETLVSPKSCYKRIVIHVDGRPCTADDVAVA